MGGVVLHGASEGNGVIVWLRQRDSFPNGDWPVLQRGDTAAARGAIVAARFMIGEVAHGVPLDSGTVTVTREGGDVISAHAPGSGLELAREFGFCYGVDRAVEYAYETRTKFPDKRIFLVGEIIHNPHVNRKLHGMGVEFLHRPEAGDFDFSAVTPSDVVLLPAFGVTVQDFERLRAVGCVLVDTTCGRV